MIYVIIHIDNSTKQYITIIKKKSLLISSMDFVSLTLSFSAMRSIGEFFFYTIEACNNLKFNYNLIARITKYRKIQAIKMTD